MFMNSENFTRHQLSSLTRNNNRRGHMIEKVIATALHGSIVCQNIDLVWRGISIEVKSSAKINKSGAYYFDILRKSPAKFWIFVGIRNKQPYHFWVMSKKTKSLQNMKTIGLMPQDEEPKGKKIYRKFYCSSFKEVKKRIHK